MSSPERPRPPRQFDDSPEWTPADTAAARRGAPWLWAASEAVENLRGAARRLRDEADRLEAEAERLAAQTEQ